MTTVGRRPRIRRRLKVDTDGVDVAAPASLSVSLLELLLRGASSTIAATPTEQRYLATDAITSLAPLLAPRLFGRTRANFARILHIDPADPVAQRLARASIRNFGRMAIDFLWVRTLSNSVVESITELTDDHHLWDALRANRGAILVMPHMGCWDVAAARASAAGLPIAIVTEGTWAARLAAASRGRPGISLAPRDRSLRALFRALRDNHGVVLLSDLVRSGLQSLTVPFFGSETPLPSGPARLSQHTGAPIVAVACVRTSTCRYRVEFRPPIWPNDQSVKTITTDIALEFETLIRGYPDQWYPFGRIWFDG